ncbi:MAG: helix-hairpin-helix domain-containing protein [Acidobacteriota bacterium]|nr:helix-hairpin-helix domain-containing protein [Acidobacteriota bacterium]
MDVRNALLISALLTGTVSSVHNATSPQALIRDQNQATPTQKVDINHASVDQLVQIPGLTRVWAERIFRYRPYRGRNDLLLNGIVPSGVYQRIKDHIIAHQQPQ